MKWQKRGQIFTMENIHPLLLTHAANPLPVFLKENIFRVFYSGRDAEKRSSVSFVDIDIQKETVVFINPEPLITFGKPESFYSHGISVGNSYRNQDGEYILFMGWQIPLNQHWRGHIGRLKLIDKELLKPDPDQAFLQDDDEDHISLSYPFVLFDKGIYKMWYGSTLSWDSSNGEMVHVIKYASSDDGRNWKKHGVAIPYAIGVAQAFSRPSVIVDEKGYHMWYSYRSGDRTSYRIGYSFSKDGLTWKNNLEHVGIDVSTEGWDNEMICYPFVFDHNNKRYMLYNGNDYGKAGFGLAILEQDN